MPNSIMRYATERKDKQWSQHLVDILHTNPFTVSEVQLYNLYRAIKAELWPGSPPPQPEEGEGPILFVVWFCRGVPAIIDIVGSVTEHLGQEYSWADYARLMKKAVEDEGVAELNPSSSLLPAHHCSGENPEPFPIELRLAAPPVNLGRI